MSKEKRQKPKQKKGNELIKTMVASGVAGIIIIILMAVIFMQIFDDYDKKDPISEKTDENINESIDETKDIIEKEMVKVTGVIYEINYSGKEVTLRDVVTNEEIIIHLTNSSEIMDEYGKPMTLQEIVKGDIIYSKYNKLNGEPEIFRLSSEAWEYNTDGLIVKVDEKKVYRGTEDYYYTDNLIIMDHGSDFSMEQLTEVDNVTIKGYKQQLLSIELMNGHGYIELVNYNYFVDAVITIDRNQTFVIHENMEPIVVQEGKHKILIEKEAFDDYIQEVIVLPNEITRIDLDKFEIKKGEIEFNINRENVQIFLNGKEIKDISEQMILDYGEYQLKVEDDGKIIYENQLIVDQPFTLYNITIAEPEPELERQIHFNSETIGVKVFINNQFIGYVPMTIALDPGDHSVLLSKEGYQNATYNIKITEGTKDLFFTFPALTAINGTNENTDNNPNDANSNDENNNSNSTDNNSTNDNNNVDDTIFETPVEDVYNND